MLQCWAGNHVGCWRRTDNCQHLSAEYVQSENLCQTCWLETGADHLSTTDRLGLVIQMPGSEAPLYCRGCLYLYSHLHCMAAWWIMSVVTLTNKDTNVSILCHSSQAQVQCCWAATDKIVFKYCNCSSLFEQNAMYSYTYGYWSQVQRCTGPKGH